MKDSKLSAAFAIEDLIKSQQENLIALSNTDNKKLLKNQRNRLASAKAFANATQQTLDFIIAYSDSDTLESLIRSDDKDSCSNYKTAKRIRQLADYLIDIENSNDTTVKTVISNFKSMTYDKYSVNDFVNKLYSVDAMSKNFTKALFFFDLIKTDCLLKNNNKFIHTLKADKNIILIKQ